MSRRLTKRDENTPPALYPSHEAITISAGVCSFSEGGGDGLSWKDIVKKPDIRLYMAKEGGRNRAVSEG